jgi:hypothetical protein
MPNFHSSNTFAVMTEGSNNSHNMTEQLVHTIVSMTLTRTRIDTLILQVLRHADDSQAESTGHDYQLNSLQEEKYAYITHQQAEDVAADELRMAEHVLERRHQPLQQQRAQEDEMYAANIFPEAHIGAYRPVSCVYRRTYLNLCPVVSEVARLGHDNDDNDEEEWKETVWSKYWC